MPHHLPAPHRAPARVHCPSPASAVPAKTSIERAALPGRAHPQPTPWPAPPPPRRRPRERPTSQPLTCGGVARRRVRLPAPSPPPPAFASPEPPSPSLLCACAHAPWCVPVVPPLMLPRAHAARPQVGRAARRCGGAGRGPLPPPPAALPRAARPPRVHRPGATARRPTRIKHTQKFGRARDIPGGCWGVLGGARRAGGAGRGARGADARGAPHARSRAAGAVPRHNPNVPVEPRGRPDPDPAARIVQPTRS
jgi:hypothetical protein